MHNIYALLPIIFFAVSFVLFQFRLESRRISFMSAALLWGIAVVCFTEIPSLFDSVNFITLCLLWTTADALLIVLLARLGKGKKIAWNTELKADRFELFMLGCILCILLIVGATALLSPPNTCDSLTYHMSRVEHWRQNGNVSFYPTNILRQLILNPWSEYAILHFQILSNGDTFANLVQWFCMAGCCVGVSVIAMMLGAGMRGQILSALVSAAIPMGILQGSSTQTDYVASFWLVAFVCFFMMLRKTPGILLALSTGCAFGLAVFTKATAYVYALPFFLWLGLPSLFRSKLRFWKIAAIVFASAILINSGQYARNFKFSQNPLGSFDQRGYSYTNEIFTIPAFVSNMVRHAAVHLGIPHEPANNWLNDRIVSLHEIMGIDVNDPLTTMFPHMGFRVMGLATDENHTGNTIHFLLFLALVPVFIITGQYKNKDFTAYAIVAGSLFFLFCLVMKWQPWHSRLHLPIFVLWAPFCGLTLAAMSSRFIDKTIVLFLVLSAGPCLFANNMRPFIGKHNILNTSRNSQYFKFSPDMERYYRIAAEYVAQWGENPRVGLIFREDNLEYPIWVLTKQKNPNIRIEHIEVRNLSKNIKMKKDFEPDIVISAKRFPGKKAVIGGTAYNIILQERFLGILSRTNKE